MTDETINNSLKAAVNITEDFSINEKGDSNFKSFPIPEVKNYVNNTIRGNESSSSALNGEASMALRDTGDVSLSAGILAHINMNKQYGSIEEVCLNKSTMAPVCDIFTNDILINNHKLNNKIYELADWKKVLEKTSVTDISGTGAAISDDISNYKSVKTYGTVGGITMLGTVLTRSWDIELGRYVLIRRLINIPLFSPNVGN